MSGKPTTERIKHGLGLLPTVQPVESAKVFCNAIVEEPAASSSEVKGAGIWLVDRNMRVLWMNDTMEEIYGPLKDLRGGHCFSEFRGRTSKCADCLPSRAMDSGNIISGYVSRETKDGIKRYYQLVEAPIMDEQDQVTRVLEIVLDVTEKARLEKTLQKSEQEYRALFAHAGTAVVVTDSKGYLTKVNRQFEELSGYQRNELEGKMHYLQFVHPKDRERVKTYDNQRSVNPNSVPSSYEFIFVNRWGGERKIHISVNSLPGEGYQISSLIDLTEKWQLEQEIRSKDQFLANILRHSVEAIVAMDRDGNIRSWNHGAELMFGFKPSEIMGRKFSTLFAPEFRRTKEMKKVVDQFHRQGFLRNFVVDALTKDRKRKTIEITRTAIHDSEGKELGSSAIIRDITVKKRMEQRMIQQEKMLALGELAATLAHEVKNPLNSMVINMEVMKSHLANVPDDNRQKVDRYLDILSGEIQRLNKVMQGVTDFARPLQGRFEKVDLRQIIDAVIELLSAQAKRSKIKIQTEIADDDLEMEGNRDHLKQILINLLLNAFQAMPRGGKATLKIKRNKKNHIEIDVTDTGTGIPKNHFKKIFDLYFSTKEKGSGLGLPLVKRIVTEHGGKITFRSKLRHGTTFNIVFPTE